jgi:hypothetical protein
MYTKKIILITFLWVIYFSNNVACMQQACTIKEPPLFPLEIEGKIITIILDLCIQEIENVIEYMNDRDWTCEVHVEPFSYQLKDLDDFNYLDKVLYWIYTHAKPVMEYIDLNSRSKKGNTLLHHAITAAWEDHYRGSTFDFACYLLKKQANPNILNNEGHSAFFIYLGQLVELEDDYNEKQALLFNLLINAHADPDITSKNNTCLHIFASKKEPGKYSGIIEETIKRMKNKKILINKTIREFNESPALYATCSLNIPFLRMLLAEDTLDLTIKNSSGDTPLSLALTMKNSRIYRDEIEKINSIIDLLQAKMQINNQ